ncbi:hypothetical protein WDU94_003067 [Cyamophila willieti]
MHQPYLFAILHKVTKHISSKHIIMTLIRMTVLLIVICAAVAWFKTPDEIVARIKVLKELGELTYDNDSQLIAFEEYILHKQRIYKDDDEIKLRLRLFLEDGRREGYYGGSWKSDLQYDY